MTNLEYIRTCSDMELAVFLNEQVTCFDGCPPYANLHCDLFGNKCQSCWSHWLNDEYGAEYYTTVEEEELS